MDKISYALGMLIAQNLKEMQVSGLDTARFTQAVTAMLNGEATEMPLGEAQMTVQKFLQEREAEAGRAAREAGEKFLAENAGKAGIVVLESGLQYEVLTEGTGKSPKASDSVKCHYEGRLIDGTVFDSSYQRGTPATFPLNGVIAGWTEGLQLMKEGAKFRFHIPFNLAYGANGAGESIPPYSALVFDVELLEVV